MEKITRDKCLTLYIDIINRIAFRREDVDVDDVYIDMMMNYDDSYTFYITNIKNRISLTVAENNSGKGTVTIGFRTGGDNSYFLDYLLSDEQKKIIGW